MKKIFSIFAAVLFAGSMMAADATIAKGTTNSYDDVTVNGAKAVKMGKNGAGGDMTITVGEGATALKIHAVAWKGEGNQEITISAPAGVTISPDQFTVNANDVISGAGKEFTLDSESDYEFSFAIVGAASGAVFTLTSPKRAIVWGATYEVGQAPAVLAPVISGAASFLDEVEVSIECATEDADVYYTIDGTAPSKNATKYEAPFNLNATATVKAIAIKGSDESSVAEKTFTKATVLTVDEALALDLSTPIANQYVAGVVSQIDKFDDRYSSITYWISADGKAENQLEVYSGKGLNGTAFESIEDLSLGDKVVVFGTLKQYNDIKEFDKENIIVKLEKASAPTAVENTAVEMKATKIVRDGQLYILRDGQLFTATGAAVK